MVVLLNLIFPNFLNSVINSRMNSKMLPSFNRAERLMNRLVGDRVMTAAGKDWLVAMIDPFHDTELKHLSGWPDVETGYSVVRKVKQQLSVVVPNAAPFIGNNWDMLITIGPIMDDKFWSPTTGRINQTATWTNGNAGRFGGCHVWAVKPGTAWAPFSGSPDTVSVGSLELGAPYTTGVGRCVGLGFEVVNTTAALNRQGSCTVFKHMQTQRDPCNFKLLPSAVGAILSDVTATIYHMIPTDLAGLALLPGSRTWKAEEGAYLVGHFHTNENPPFSADYNIPFLTLTDDIEDVTSGNALYIPQFAAGAIANSYTPNPTHVHPLHTNGAYFAGLSNSSTFMVTLIYYYETFPSLSQADILNLATPSAGYDPVALEIYSHCLSTMPPGVVLAENPLGEWFADVVDKVSNALAYIPHPLAQALSAAGKAGTGIYRGTLPALPAPGTLAPAALLRESAPAPQQMPFRDDYTGIVLNQGRRKVQPGIRAQGPFNEPALTARRTRRRAKKAPKN